MLNFLYIKKLIESGVDVEDERILAIFNRFPTDYELESGIVNDENERMIDSEIFSDGDSYDAFMDSPDVVDLDVQVTAIHNINTYGFILGLSLIHI